MLGLNSSIWLLMNNTDKTGLVVSSKLHYTRGQNCNLATPNPRNYPDINANLTITNRNFRPTSNKTICDVYI